MSLPLDYAASSAVLEYWLMSDEFRPARADELEAVFALSALAFQRGTATDWAAALERDPWRDEGETLVAVADGCVVGSLRVCARRITAPPGVLRLAGIGNVGSHPAARRQGYIRRLLALAHQRNRAAGYDLAMLFTGVPWVYSGSAAFEVMPFWWLDLPLQHLPAAAGLWTVEPFDLARDLGAVREVYEQFGRQRPGYPVRDDAFWMHPARQADVARMRVALDAAGRVGAYLRLRLGLPDGRAGLGELPYVEADAALALYADLHADPSLAGCTTLAGRLSRDHVLGTLPGARWQVYSDSMATAYTSAGESLLVALRDGANERAVYWMSDGF